MAFPLWIHTSVFIKYQIIIQKIIVCAQKTRVLQPSGTPQATVRPDPDWGVARPPVRARRENTRVITSTNS